jgi:hypothetical protein
MKYYKLDKDVKQYLKRMAVDGIKTPADIYSVNDFVVGLKDLNLYSGLIDLWFTRSLQNAGISTKLYAFKSSYYDATITSDGSPTWTANGIRTSVTAGFSAPSIWIPNGADLLARYPVTSFCVFNCYNTSWTSNYYWMYGNGFSSQTNDQNNGGWFRVAVGVDVLNQMRGQTLTSATTFSHGIFQLNGNTTINQASNNSRNYRNGSLSSTQTAFGPILPRPTNASGGKSYQIGGSFGTVANGTISFHSVFENDFSTTDHLNFYNLYKVTAGKGLGLP